ncbi:hypothetical protein [Mesobacillus selenatarsenatis]|nr:hypothetical protein [Mesobacillus selenatarsenatis]
MEYVRYSFYQFILFCSFFVLNIIFDHYVSNPFTRVDTIAILIGIPVVFLILLLQSKLYKRFDSIKMWKKIMISIPILIISISFVGYMGYMVFGFR